MIDRRSFIGCLALAPLVVADFASAAKKVYRVGVLIPGALSAGLNRPESPNPYVDGFLSAMRERGYIRDDNFIIEARAGQGRVETFHRLADELVDLKMDVIVAAGPMLGALKQTNTSVPVVMAAASDPVEEGFAQSLARPGRNFTGMSLQAAETTGKRLELLRELVPSNASLAVLWETPFAQQIWRAAEVAARTRGWQVQSLEVREADEIERRFQSAHSARAGGLLVHPSGLFDRHAARITQLAIQYRLPAMYGLPRYVELGGLMSYSPNLVAVWKRAAHYVDKILNGANPADLPIEQPTEFQLLINQKAAKEIGLVFPQSLLLRATPVAVLTPPPVGSLKLRA